MIKYFDVDSYDSNRGQRIRSVNSLNDVTKTATAGYSSEIMSFIDTMERKPNRYYVVIDAVGSFEVWGANNNGDSFPRASLNNFSMRSDMGSSKDYGYKTFEYYGKLFKHHANKPYHPHFGEVLYAYWNGEMERVELVVAVDTVSGSDIVLALEEGSPVAVSMGSKQPYDVCSICGNKARTRNEYCKHLKGHLRQVVTPELASLWTKELGRQVFIGEKVHAINPMPRFFDISKVRIGADRTAFILGKVASEEVISSVDMADVYGITDEDIDKLAEIDKEIGGDIGDHDGAMIPVNQIKESVEAAVEDDIINSPGIPNEVLNRLGGYKLKDTLASLLGLGVHLQPREFQRIVLVNMGEPDLANRLESRGVVFRESEEVAPMNFEVAIKSYIANEVANILKERSFLPPFVFGRIHPSVMIKKASMERATGSVDKMPNYHDPLMILGAIAAMYQGLKMKASGLTMNQIATAVTRNPAIMTMIGGGLLAKMYTNMSNSSVGVMNVPASHYEGALPKINLVKTAGAAESLAGNTVLAGVIGIPLAGAVKSYNTKAKAKGERQVNANLENQKAVPVVTATGALATGIAKNKIMNAVF